MDLVVAHRRLAAAAPVQAAGTPLAPTPDVDLTWRTCLREITFLSGEDDETVSHVFAAPDAALIRGGEAYALLLEILCGLDSPMLGETQVLGQFRAFLADARVDRAGASGAWLRRFGHTLIADARDVREGHLRHLGSRSYGSAVRRRVDVVGCRRAAIIGAGLLASEIAPFLQGDDRVLDAWTRQGRLAAIDDVPACVEPAALIVAAPVTADVVAAVARRYPALALVLDLRGEADADPVRATAPVITLSALFDDVADARARADVQTSAARAAIAAKSRNFHVRADVRPFGWDDLCA